MHLGYYMKRRFEIKPVIVGSPEYLRLLAQLDVQTQHMPLVQIKTSPSDTQCVVAVEVVAKKSDMPNWERFFSKLK